MTDLAGTMAGTIMARLAGPIVRHRLALALVGLALTAALHPVARTVEYDRSVRSLFPPGHPRLVGYENAVTWFGGDAICLACYTDDDLLTADGLARLKALSDRLAGVPGVLSTNCLADQPRPGDRSFVTNVAGRLLGSSRSVGAGRSPEGGPADESAVPGSGAGDSRPIWKTLAEWFADPTAPHERIRAEVVGCELYRDQLVGADGRTAAIVLMVDRTAMADGRFRETLAELRRITADHPRKVAIVGSPAMISDVYTFLDQDAWTLTTISLGTMLLVILVLFRNLRWAALPFLVVHATLIWTQALMAVTGIRLSIVGSMTTALVTVIGIATGIHLAVCYREKFERDGDGERALRRTLTRIGAAIFWTGATTAAGFGSLGSSEVAPVRHFGFIMAAASMFVSLAYLLFLPACTLLGRFRSSPRSTPGEGALASGLESSASAIRHHPALWGFGMLALLALAGLGFTRLEVETDFTKNFREDSSLLVGYRFVENRLGGAGVVELIIDAPRSLTPEYLDRVRKLSAELRTLDGVTKSTTLADFLDFFDAPPAAAATGQPGGLFGLGGVKVESLLPAGRKLDLQIGGLQAFRPDVLRRFWNPEAGKMLLQLRVREQQTVEGKRRQLERVERIASAAMGRAEVTGLYVLLVHLIDNLLGDQVLSFAISAFAIILMTWAAFRSVPLGVIGFMPNVVPIVLVVGVMGWLGWKINVATAMIGSISMGLTVDFSLHYLNRFRQERRLGRSVADAVDATHRSTGKAMVFANLALMLGFSVLVFSQFVPTIHFGMLVSVAILGGLVGNLVLLPVQIRLLERLRSGT